MGKLTLSEHLRRGVLAAKTFSAGLISELAQTTAGAIQEIDQAKADKGESITKTIPTTGWSSDSTAGYPKYYDIPVTGITAKDRAEITIAVDSLDAARACGLCPTNQTLAGKIRVRASDVPTTALNVEYWIEKGKG